MGSIIMILINSYFVYAFLFAVMFLTVGELHIYLPKYLSMGVVISYVILSSYNMNMLKRETQQQPTPVLYHSGISITIQTILTILIYIGGIYTLLKIY